MISWEMFSEAEHALKLAAAEKWQITDIACPECGDPLYKDTTVVLTTYPPKSRYECKQCGFAGTA